MQVMLEFTTPLSPAPFVQPAALAQISAISLFCKRNDRMLFGELAFSVAAGEILHIRGPNGSGKTTLLRILCGLALPDAGEVRWCGEPIQALGPGFAGQLAYIGHGNALKLDLTALENLEFGRHLLTHDTARSSDSILEECGLGDCADSAVSRLSAGQRRRLSLARLLLSSVPLWLLDEPYTSLDADGRTFAANLVNGHAAAGGLAIIAGHDDFGVRGTQREIRL
ncbi:MAG: cytochrome c biogenesis heme-transporting ATPase CcmA [Burkholderiales bacterium]